MMMMNSLHDGRQLTTQWTGQVDEFAFLCLFSLICFGQRHETPHKLGSGSCAGYQNAENSSSYICTGNIDTYRLKSLKLHTLAFDESNSNLQESDVCDLRFKHLIFKGLTFRKSARICDCISECKRKHQSVTLYNCENIKKWSWDYLNFDHIHIERSDLSTSSSISGLKLPKQLKSLSYVSCLIKSIPENHFIGLNSLEIISLSKNSLKTIERNSFPDSGLPLLWSLDLSHNQISYIDTSLTSYLPNLIEINLKSNHIQTLDSKLLTKIWPSIKIMDVSANALICDRLCWTTEPQNRPHPKLFDDSICYAETADSFAIWSLGTEKSKFGC